MKKSQKQKDQTAKQQYIKIATKQNNEITK